MEIHIEGNVGRPIPRGHVRARMRRVLSRLPVHPVTAHVTFADVHGPVVAGVPEGGLSPGKSSPPSKPSLTAPRPPRH